MTNIIIQIFTSTIFISTIFSCNGQEHSQSGQHNNPKLGTLVSEIDHQIWDIFQDSKGHYWFGSNGNGLYNFDGDQITNYTTNDGLAHNQIRGIQEDHKGNLYFETHNGISKFNGTSFTTLQPFSSRSNAWELNPNDLWFGYNSNDLCRYDGDTLYELQLPRKDLKKAFATETDGVPFEGNNSPYAVFGVNKDAEGNMWFGTATAGAFRYDGDSIWWFAEKELSTLPDGRVPGVRSMVQDREGYFWLSNFNSKYLINTDLPKGYEKIKATFHTKENIDEEDIYFMSSILDEEGTLWATTYGEGVWKYDGDSLTNIKIHNGVEDVLLICIHKDRTGTIWIGSNNDGVYVKKGENFIKFQP